MVIFIIFIATIIVISKLYYGNNIHKEISIESVEFIEYWGIKNKLTRATVDEKQKIIKWFNMISNKEKMRISLVQQLIQVLLLI